MKRLNLPSALLLAALLAACASPDSRIRDSQAAFDSYPPAVQQKIRAGQADVGFTPEQARMALGEPDRKFTRTTAAGSSEVWAYRDSGPMFSFGVGGGSFGSHTGVGGGVGVATGGDAPDDKLRLVFVNGAVVSIEKTQ
ncbi:MAG: hypothetical protein JOY51_06600 [Nevskia sp.]|nr:hypothetical protein [Nevskia sp.]